MTGKKIQQNFTPKIPYKWHNIYSGMHLSKLQSSNSLLHFSMHYYHSILCVFKFEPCMSVFPQILCQKKDSVQQHDPFSFSSELKNGYSNQHPSYENSKLDKTFKIKENTTQYEHFYGY